MEKKNTGLIKDILISILIFVCIVLALGVIFYDNISLSKVIPESEEYELSEEMQEDLNETTSQDTTEVVTKYYIDASDLKKYEQTKEYNKGKKNPFAVESTVAENNTTNTNTNEDTSSSNSTNFYEDDGTK